MRTWWRRGLWTLAALVLLGAAGAAVYAGRALPRTDGLLHLHGVAAELRIERDGHGIPTLRARSEPDLHYALGVVHAQDRLWQLEMHRRIAAGRLAEVLGPAALETDRFLRALGVRRAAAAQWARLPAESKAALQAYAAGINAVLRDGGQARPPEMLILGITPEPWEPVDSLAWALMMAWDLGGNWTTELLRLRLALQMPVARINELLPPYPGEQPLPTADYAALYRGLKLDGAATTTAWQGLEQIAPESGVQGVGSNNWVLAGHRSTTGRPLLANDPHLRLSTPALWYLARLVVDGPAAGQASGLPVAGATLPGVPGVVLGQNSRIAWGYTNTAPDVQDLYLEQVDPQDSTRYRTPEGWAPFETAAEVIRVKGGPDVVMTVRRTRHGPVISDAGTVPDVLGPREQPSHVLALRWTALDADNDPVGPAMAMQRAPSVAAFFAATRGWVAPMQNMVVADVDGHIGFIAPGRVPQRRPDNDLHGVAPAPGWDTRYDWAGWVPADETPRQTDPDSGVIATANQRITAPGYPHYLSSEWALPYRQQRIEQALGARPQHSLDDLAALQADVKSLAVPALLPWLLKAKSVHPLAPAARAALDGFDGTMAAERAAPLLFWAWQRQLAQAIFADDVSPALWQKSLSSRHFQDALEGVLQRDDAAWCDDRRTPLAETCAEQAGAALTRALEELRQLQGDDVDTWRWGRAHQVRAEHRPFSRVPVLAGLFELRAPVGGDTQTVNVTRVNLRPDSVRGERYLSDHGASLRALYDVGQPALSRVILSSGQSGIVFSPLYRSFLQPWLQGQAVPLWPRPVDEGGAAPQVLVVRPAAR
ncbi:MAG: penicillin acylase family protein [Rubrivivax sp.]|nr:penicillin acylase family protein [Rubrivivax sp.]